MKNNYELFNKVIYLIIMYFILLIICVVLVFNIKISTYDIYSGVFIGDNILEVVTDNKKIFDRNKTIFINNRKLIYKKILIEKDVLTKKYIITLKLNKTKYKSNEIIFFSIFNKKISLVELFEIIWKGE